MTPYEALLSGCEDLLGGTIYLGGRPDGAEYPCICLMPYAGSSSAYLPTDEYRVQVNCYGYDQQAAAVEAHRVYGLLHQRYNWALTDWMVMGAYAAQPPFPQPAGDGQGALLYRYCFNVVMTVRPDNG